MSRIVTSRTRRYQWAPAFPFCIDYDSVPYISVAFMPIEGGGIVLGQGSTVAISRRSSETYFTSALGPIGPVLRTVESGGAGGVWDTPAVLGITPADANIGEAGIITHGTRRSTGNNYAIFEVQDQDGMLGRIKHHLSEASTKVSTTIAYNGIGGYYKSFPWTTSEWLHFQIWCDYNGSTWDTRGYVNGVLQTIPSADSEGLRTYQDPIADPSDVFFRFPQSYQRDVDLSFIAFAVGRAPDDHRTALYEDPYFWLYKLDRIRYFFAGGLSAGTSYAGTISDSTTITDAQGGVIAASGSVSDSTTITDAQSAIGSFGVSTAETVTLSDSDSGIGVLIGTLAEALSIADAQSGVIAGAGSYDGTTDESVTLTDSTTVAALFSGTVSESVSIGDSVGGIAVFLGSIAETATLTDAQSGTLGSIIAGTVGEILTLTDQQLSSATVTATINEALSLIDSISVDGGSAAQVNRGGWATNQRRRRLRMIQEDDEIVAAIIARLLQ